MPDCKSCKEKRNAELIGAKDVPYISHEAEMARVEREHDKEREQWNKEREQHKRTVRWLCSIIIVLALGLIGMFIYETQFETVTTTIEAEQESETGSNYAVGGDFTYGETESEDYDYQENP